MTTFDQLSDKAQELMTTALAADGRAKGLITLTPALGGAHHITAGDHYEVLFGDDATQAQMAIYDLVDLGLINETAACGYMVTPLGCDLEIELNSSKPLSRSIEETGPNNPKVEQTIEDIPIQQAGKGVFVVHGRDVGAKDTVARFLIELELDPIILQELPGRGRTIAEKFDDHAKEAGFAIVIFTPDDEGTLAGKGSNLQPRARQNVVFELGFFIGQLGRSNVSVLHKGDVEIPSDYAGVEYIPLTDADAWKFKLITELQSAGLAIDANKATRRS